MGLEDDCSFTKRANDAMKANSSVAGVIAELIGDYASVSVKLAEAEDECRHLRGQMARMARCLDAMRQERDEAIAATQRGTAMAVAEEIEVAGGDPWPDHLWPAASEVCEILAERVRSETEGSDGRELSGEHVSNSYKSGEAQ